jgi:alginate export protein
MKPGVLIPGAEVQGFVLRYNDHRDVTARPDNSGLAASRADVGINTFGGTLILASHPDDGRQWDGLLWFAGQTGSWFDQRHRAASVVAEAGHQWAGSRWQPWLRGGITWASGDRDALDDRHDTFFQMLPTVRRYAQSAAYSQMNNTDLFAQVLLRPAPSLTVRGDLHRVGLASSRDHWYFGSGATQARGAVFGFSTRPSGGQTDLGTVVEASGDYAIRRHWSVNAYVGIVRGGHVVQHAFEGHTMTFAYVENVLQF